jgi:hypothetical protein
LLSANRADHFHFFVIVGERPPQVPVASEPQIRWGGVIEVLSSDLDIVANVISSSRPIASSRCDGLEVSRACGLVSA